MKTSYIIKRLMPYLAKHKKLLIVDLLCAMTAAVTNIISPMTVRYITNRIDSLTIGALAAVIIIYTLILGIASAVNFYMVHKGNVFGARVETDMRLDLFTHLQKLSYSFYAENSIGQIMARLTGDLTDCASFVHIIPEQLLVAGGTLIVSFIMLMRINILLTVTVFAFLPLVFVSTKYFNKRMRGAMKEQRVQVGEINSQIEDTLSGIRLVKSFANEYAEIEKFSKRNNRYLQIKSKTFFQLAGFQVTTSSLGGVVYIAVVGPSGGGKTTLINLIPRFYDVSGGEILINGEKVKNLSISSIRQAIGLVQQDVYLFSGTVFENIVYGKLGASRDEVIKAAKQAGAHEFIMSLENGYDTYIGERGVKLSGGQKQRISIARVFLKNPPILILDEATSALDNESEKLIQESLEQLSKGRTVITIAHRLTTIQNADKIMVLTPKGIEETGTHNELLEKRGIYYNMYTAADRRDI